MPPDNGMRPTPQGGAADAERWVRRGHCSGGLIAIRLTGRKSIPRWVGKALAFSHEWA